MNTIHGLAHAFVKTADGIQGDPYVNSGTVGIVAGWFGNRCFEDALAVVEEVFAEAPNAEGRDLYLALMGRLNIPIEDPSVSSEPPPDLLCDMASFEQSIAEPPEESDPEPEELPEEAEECEPLNEFEPYEPTAAELAEARW